MAAAGSTTISIIPSLNQDTLIFSISAGVPIHSGVFIPAEEGFGLAAESPVHALMAGAALFTPKGFGPDRRHCSLMFTGPEGVCDHCVHSLPKASA